MALFMDEFLKMDIFFVVTSTVVVLLGVASLVALYYIIKILRSVSNVAKNASEESDSVRGDIEILRGKLKEEGVKVKHFADFVGSVAGRSRARKAKHKQAE